MSAKLPFRYSGKVIPGEKQGRLIGFPTANFDTSPNEDQLDPGVYHGLCWIGDDPKGHHSLTYFGPRYIFGEKRNNFETYIYDFSDEVYQKEITVELTTFIRSPLPFSSLEETEQQLHKDKQAGLELLAQNRV